MTTRRLLLKSQDLKQVLQRYLDRLRQYREALNRLNVYPVPDGDTGTNMTQTVESVVAATRGAESMEQVATAIAHGSLMGAQGNSGIILSQILRGLADAFRGEQTLGSAQIVDALDRASTAAYKAVGRPVEGTILTVLREAAGAAASTDTPAGEDLAEFLLRVYQRAEAALQSTPELLPVLKQAGVVDAGGAGFLLLLAAFLEEVTGEEVALPEAIFRAAAVHLLPAPEPAEGDISGLRYEVMYLLRSDAPDAGDRLRDAWDAIGDSIVVVGDGGMWNCHIHTDVIGPAIEAGVAVGRPERIKVTDLLLQAADEAHHREPAYAPLPAFAESPVGVVAVAVGPGVVELFRHAGAQGVVIGGQTMNPSVRDVLDVVEGVPAGTVIVLPNNKNIIPVAEQLDALSTKTVHVVPTRSVPQGLAAMLAFHPGRDAAAGVTAMGVAAEACSWGEVTRAVRDASTPAGEIREGDWLGTAHGEVVAIAADAGAAASGVLAALVDDDSEVVTVITGAEADATVTDEITATLAATHPVTVTVLAGGQPLYPYLFGVE